MQNLTNTNSRDKIQPSIEINELSSFLIRFLNVYSKDVTPANYVHLLGIITYVDYQ